MTDPAILWFEDLAIGDVPSVGGKNASLGEMTRELGAAGVRIPTGFATTAQAWREKVPVPIFSPLDSGQGRRHACAAGGPLAQLVEHRPFKPRVEGSSPSRPTRLPLDPRGLPLAADARRTGDTTRDPDPPSGRGQA